MTPATPGLAPCGFVHRVFLAEEALTRSLPSPFTSPSCHSGGCGPASRPKRGASSMRRASRCGCAAQLPTISTLFTGTPENSQIRMDLGGHTIAEICRAEPGGTDGALGLVKLVELALLVPHRMDSLRISGSSKSDPSFYALPAHLLQQVVDARAPEHVEKTGSKPSIDP